MDFVLGIDAGGTYTDAVVYSRRQRTVWAKAKSLTTPPLYSEGIRTSLEQLPRELLSEVEFVGLSTTLATNAVVTGRRGPAGLILVGFPKRSVEMVRFTPRRVVTGQMSITGQELVPLDEDGLQATIGHLVANHRVGAIAVSGLNSVMNPAHELRAAEIIRELTNLPVVLGSQMSMQLDAVRRAITAGLNAQLLPLVSDFLSSVRRTLVELGMTAPLAVVRCDGTLMAAGVAAKRPIETILSGPAASMMGAYELSRRPTAMVVDMGGTTTDVAALSDGQVRTNPAGATIGGYRTSVPAVNTRTHGLGGDSFVRFHKDRMQVGPERVIPLSLLAKQHPSVVTDLKALMLRETSQLVQPVEFLVVRKSSDVPGLTEHDRAVLAALAAGPLSRFTLAERLGAVHESLIGIGHLERLGLVGRAALTPTDAMHVEGSFTGWSVEGAELGMRICAKRARCDWADLAGRILTVVRHELARHLIEARLADEGHEPDAGVNSPLLKALYEKAFLTGQERDTNGRLGVRLILGRPIVGVGAPIGVCLPAVADRLGVECIVPEHADVAGAVGAAAASMLTEVHGTITSPARSVYACHCDDGRFEFGSLSEAKLFMADHLRRNAHDRAVHAGADQIVVHVELKDRFGSGIDWDGPTDIYLETVALARATGQPRRGKAGE